MRRNIFGTRPVRSLTQAFGTQQPRRAFATPPTKDTSPPSPIEPSKTQAHPIGPFYEAILNSAQPIPDKKPEVPPVTAKTSPPSPPIAPAPEAEAAPAPAPTPAKRGRKPKENGKAKSNDDASVQARASVVFGSSLAGPAERAERLAAIRSRSRLIAGVLVPPRPEEPDNCCMSGCVNCVWDRYRDEMEHWASAHSEAERRLRAQEAGVAATGRSMEKTGKKISLGVHELDGGAVSMDDDGGGSVGNWDLGPPPSSSGSSKGSWDEELYKNVPVGIREFMKHEKRLKEKHVREGTMGG